MSALDKTVHLVFFGPNPFFPRLGPMFNVDALQKLSLDQPGGIS